MTPDRGRPRIGITAMGDGPIGGIARSTERLHQGLPPEDRGHLWIAEAYVARDAIAQAAAALALTEGLRVATGIVNLYTRHPALLLMAAATLEEEFPGRFALGIGAGEKSWISMLGLEAERPLAELGATIAFLEAMRGEGRARYEGPQLATDELRLPRALRHEVPTVIGTMGPKTIGLAGAATDGVMFSFHDGDFDRLAENCGHFRDGSGGSREPGIGCVAQCFVTGPWLDDDSTGLIARLASAMGAKAKPGRAPAVVEVDLAGAADLLGRFAEAGVDEVSFVAPASSAARLTDFLAEAGGTARPA